MVVLYLRFVTLHFWMSAAPDCAQNYISRLTHRLWGVHLYVIEDADLKKISFSNVKKNAGLSLEIWRQNLRPTTVKRPNIACDDSVDTGCASECMCPTMT